MKPLKGQIVPGQAIYTRNHPHPINIAAGGEKAIHFLITVSIIPSSQRGRDHCVGPLIFRREIYTDLMSKCQMDTRVTSNDWTSIVSLTVKCHEQMND